MRELKLDVKSLYPDLTQTTPYDYSILVDEMPVGGFACESYGVRITSQVTGEQADIPNLTVSISRIDDLMTSWSAIM